MSHNFTYRTSGGRRTDFQWFWTYLSPINSTDKTDQFHRQLSATQNEKRGQQNCYMSVAFSMQCFVYNYSVHPQTPSTKFIMEILSVWHIISTVHLSKKKKKEATLCTFANVFHCALRALVKLLHIVSICKINRVDLVFARKCNHAFVLAVKHHILVHFLAETISRYTL